MSAEIVDTLDDLDLDSLGVGFGDPDPAVVISATKRPASINSRTGTAPLYFDLETIPDYSRIDLFDLPAIPGPVVETPYDQSPKVHEVLTGTVPQIKAALAKFVACDDWLTAARDHEVANKNRSGVLDVLTDAADLKNAAENAIAARRKRMATSPEMCRIVSAAFARGEGDTICIVVNDSIDETHLLSRLWQEIGNSKPLIGFNVLGFDLPVVFTRSMLLGVEPSKLIDRKAWGADVLDLMATRWPRGEAMKLKSWARALGVEVPAGDCDGSQVEELWESDRKKLAEYNASDVEITREIHRRGKGIWWL